MIRVVRDHIRSLAENGAREDGRDFLECRKPIKIEYGVSPKSADGSARVTIGDTEVVAGVKLDVGEPFSDTPDEGVLMVGAELLPLSNPEFESGPPNINSIELARIIDRGIRESKCIDFSKLCIKKGEKVWMAYVDIYPINDSGNLFDAASLAAIAALKDAKFPEYDAKNDIVNYEKRTNKGLPLTKLPILVTVFKIRKRYLLDPTSNEVDSLDARLSVATIDNDVICAMQKGGDEALTLEDIDSMVDIATKHASNLRKLL